MRLTMQGPWAGLSRQTVRRSGVPGAAGFEDLTQHRRSVRHDPVDPQVEQALHLRRVIDGPYVDLHAEVMGSFDEALVDHRDDLLDGHLRGKPRGMTDEPEAQHSELDRAE